MKFPGRGDSKREHVIDITQRHVLYGVLEAFGSVRSISSPDSRRFFNSDGRRQRDVVRSHISFSNSQIVKYI